MVMMPELAATQAGEERFRGIGTGTVHAVAVLVIDAPHREIGMQPVPRGTFISMDRGAIADPLTGGRQRISFGPENPRQRAATSFAHRDDHFAIRRSVLCEPTISSIDGQIFRSDMATEICTIDFRGPPFAADLQRLRARGHRLAQFVSQDKSGLILDIKVPREGKHAFALHLIAEQRDGHQVAFDRKLVRGEQGVRCDGEIRATRLAAPARLTRRPAAIVTDPAFASRANWHAIRLGPPQTCEHILRVLVGHPGHFGRAERAGGG
jgi:hypothetical protein